MDVLSAFVKRLEAVGVSKDELEAKALYNWIEQGGLKSLEPSLMTYLKEISTQAVKPVETKVSKQIEPLSLRVRRFDESNFHTFEVFPDTTTDELKKVAAEGFGLNLKDITLRYFWDKGDYAPEAQSPPMKPTVSQVLEARKKPFQPEDLTVVIVPSKNAEKWYIKSDGTIGMPINIELLDNQVKAVASITPTMTFGELSNELEKEFPNPERWVNATYGIFGPKGGSANELINHYSSQLVWPAWLRNGLSNVGIQ